MAFQVGPFQNNFQQVAPATGQAREESGAARYYKKRKKPKTTIIRRSDFESLEAYRQALLAAIQIRHVDTDVPAPAENTAPDDAPHPAAAQFEGLAAKIAAEARDKLDEMVRRKRKRRRMLAALIAIVDDE